MSKLSFSPRPHKSGGEGCNSIKYTPLRRNHGSQIHSWSDKAFKSTVVNPTCNCLMEGHLNLRFKGSVHENNKRCCGMEKVYYVDVHISTQIQTHSRFVTILIIIIIIRVDLKRNPTWNPQTAPSARSASTCSIRSGSIRVTTGIIIKIVLSYV